MSGMRDTYLIFRHNMRIQLRHKSAVLFGAAQPALFLVLFGPLFTSVGTWEILVPGLIVQLALFSAGLAGFGIVFDVRFGVLDRLRVTPAGRTPLLLGRVLGNVAVLLVQTVLLLALGYAFGLRAPLPGVLLGLALIVPLGVSLASLSYAVALTIDQETFAPMVSTVIVPLTLLSGAFLPMSMAPPWLDAVSRLTPFRYVVEALREMFTGHYATPAVAAGAAVTAALTALCLALAARVFARATA
ncbi:ABC-2 type transport system permease protein [Thermocatellispora tengchongensis]|uniref:Transport permease protein n=2 Tax=Thermocatellispora tengchongensis TaxID=1073253 RepID=A0A840P7T5_9ACTN|nr:ABC-2 type transport system permease protein [Thermocatellispora tengchongensis]